jgi:hypothetical protein
MNQWLLKTEATILLQSAAASSRRASNYSLSFLREALTQPQSNRKECPYETTVSLGVAVSLQWKNHEAYVSALTQQAQDLVDKGLLTKKQAAKQIEKAAKSNCGK